MPFFLAVASPAFGGSALTTHRGRATAAGAVMNALLPETRSVKRRQRMINLKAGRGAVAVPRGLRNALLSLRRRVLGS